jgi:hypothetical protein
MYASEHVLKNTYFLHTVLMGLTKKDLKISSVAKPLCEPAGVLKISSVAKPLCEPAGVKCRYTVCLSKYLFV